ncbi:AAA family ATPase [Anabaena cylindrica UHCC 0172]|uniref:ATP-dependent nuclease n=1 Tax=Anabaena cylindrica TaxID=1165 RepID=UPI002B21E5FC|nr:AAA family ATPase [Anabaena cylindrica]MEA5554481.1 AAA family ATPase [Anabaena cylindrica UHCC 0172]
MYISKFQISNYKSFQDSGLLEFTPGINIIVGQNNSGKTALLEALTLKFQDVPHRSINTLHSPLSILDNTVSKSKVYLFFDKQELRQILNQFLPLVIIMNKPPENITDKTVNQFIEWLNQNNCAEYIVSLCSNTVIDVDNTDLSFGLYSPDTQAGGSHNNENTYNTINIKRTVNEELKVYSTQSAKSSDIIAVKLFKLLQSRIYRFYAERLNISRCAFGSNSILEPNASNLAEVLSGLQSRNSTAFDKYNKYINQIFPHIKRIAIEPREHNQLEIMIWNIEPETERVDLAVSLSSCGTGIGQVLAILYVVINSLEPRTIIIDEPQSFLHPGAAKKLIEILKQFPQHQYFIATHSPTIINAANPSKIIMLKYEDCETKVSVINAKEAREQRSLLAEVGVSLSDVFGADNILWVEGPTEQICFPLILENVAKKSLLGTTILAVQDVGRLDNKNASLIFDIYDKLSGGSSLFPPAIGFLFDRETRSDNDEKELQKRSKKPVKLLPRRMYENYLLHPEAITAVINECDENREEKLAIEDVKEWIDKNKYETDYFPKNPKSEQISDKDWFDKIDGAKLLKELFAHFCDTRLPFSKTTHSVKLTEWLIDNQPDQLLEIVELLVNILDFKD